MTGRFLSLGGGGREAQGGPGGGVGGRTGGKGKEGGF